MLLALLLLLLPLLPLVCCFELLRLQTVLEGSGGGGGCGGGYASIAFASCTICCKSLSSSSDATGRERELSSSVQRLQRFPDLKLVIVAGTGGRSESCCR